VSRGETEAMQRERIAQEEQEKERIELEKREEEIRKNQRLKEQEDKRWEELMEEKRKREKEADLAYERAERSRKEYEERLQMRQEIEEDERRAREQRKMKPLSPFVAITQTVSGGILKTPVQMLRLRVIILEPVVMLQLLAPLGTQLPPGLPPLWNRLPILSLLEVPQLRLLQLLVRKER
jgi:DNA segregation ATPase FtsK/SpoIIIE-like protein